MKVQLVLRRWASGWPRSGSRIMPFFSVLVLCRSEMDWLTFRDGTFGTTVSRAITTEVICSPVHNSLGPEIPLLPIRVGRIPQHIYAAAGTQNDRHDALNSFGLHVGVTRKFWAPCWSNEKSWQAAEQLQLPGGGGGATPRVLGRQLPLPPPAPSPLGAFGQQLVAKGVALRRPWAPKAPDAP